VTDERRCISFETIPPFEAGFLSVRHTGGHYHPTLASFRNLALREPLHIGHYANHTVCHLSIDGERSIFD
jgi:hypothetical protein